ncbi:MAG: hypothetical protein CL561_08495 [Alphaproteobacteria bacterium]|nr:hypothetical protein [Alphaproteobacteria bacterium]|tara:strand:+ start:2218 stop:3222 length:1005 start_codon:yes stop_codon:yes gene_type:complete
MDKFSGEIFEVSARAMLADVNGAVERIVAERKQLDEDGYVDTPLYVLLGEIHNMPAHMVFHTLLLRQLQAYEDSIVVGIEGEHNYFDPDCQEPLNGGALRQYGVDSIEKALAERSTYDAFLANKFLYRSLLNYMTDNRSFLAMFNDVASKNYALDFSDRSTYEAAQAFAGEDVVDENVHVTKPLGIFLRNAFMTSTLQNLAEEQGARIAVQICGAGHVAGNYHDWTQEHSMSACYYNLGLPFLAVFLQDGIVPAYADQLTDEYKYFAQNVPTLRSFYNPATGTVDLGDKYERRTYRRNMPEIKSLDEEAAYINNTLAAIGLEDAQFNIKLNSPK